MYNFTKVDIILSSSLLCICIYFIFPLIIFYRSIFPSFHLLSQSTQRQGARERGSEWVRKHGRWTRTADKTIDSGRKKLILPSFKRTTYIGCAYEKVNTPVQFYLFPRSKWMCWASECECWLDGLLVYVSLAFMFPDPSCSLFRCSLLFC